jgi:hypothetical protein
VRVAHEIDQNASPSFEFSAPMSTFVNSIQGVYVVRKTERCGGAVWRRLVLCRLWTEFCWQQVYYQPLISPHCTQAWMKGEQLPVPEEFTKNFSYIGILVVKTGNDVLVDIERILFD